MPGHNLPLQLLYLFVVTTFVLGSRSDVVDSNWSIGGIGMPYRTSTGNFFNRSEMEYLRNRTLKAFTHTLNGYMEHAFPMEDLKPKTCQGTDELFKGTMVTLIDSLDTMVVMGLFNEFRASVKLIESHLPSYNLDVNVSVFEMNIRVLGGLLSAHSLATDPDLAIYDTVEEKYTGGLFRLAHDLGNRLLVAFDTPTGIPYGTVNLRHGVPVGETPITCTAGGGSFLMEFSTLSHLTNRDEFELAAKRSAFAIFQRRNPQTGLVGTHIDIITGRWAIGTSTVGSYVDSFYEYLFKYWSMVSPTSLTNSSNSIEWDEVDDYLVMYLSLHQSAIKHMKLGPWYVESYMNGIRSNDMKFEALQGYWPGLQALAGESTLAISTLESFMNIWDGFGGGIPDQYILGENRLVSGNERYALRPEIAESAYHLSTMVNSHDWVELGRAMLATLDKYCRTECGYANIRNVTSHTTEDRMESFFTAETLKYLYLLFSPDHWIRKSQKYSFTTEAHLLPSLRYHPKQFTRLQQQDPESLKLRASLLQQVWGSTCNKVEFPIPPSLALIHRSRTPVAFATNQPFLVSRRKVWSNSLTTHSYWDEAKFHSDEYEKAIQKLASLIAPVIEPSEQHSDNDHSHTTQYSLLWDLLYSDASLTGLLFGLVVQTLVQKPWSNQNQPRQPDTLERYRTRTLPQVPTDTSPEQLEQLSMEVESKEFENSLVKSQPVACGQQLVVKPQSPASRSTCNSIRSADASGTGGEESEMEIDTETSSEANESDSPATLLLNQVAFDNAEFASDDDEDSSYNDDCDSD